VSPSGGAYDGRGGDVKPRIACAFGRPVAAALQSLSKGAPTG
jgi:hypothetical protein